MSELSILTPALFSSAHSLEQLADLKNMSEAIEVMYDSSEACSAIYHDDIDSDEVRIIDLIGEEAIISFQAVVAYSDSGDVEYPKDPVIVMQGPTIFKNTKGEDELTLRIFFTSKKTLASTDPADKIDW